VKPETAVAVPARALIEVAAASKADLVVVGSEGRSALGRFFLGSVSHKVAVEAPCTVRVARGRLRESDDPIRIVVGFKSAPSGEEAVRAVAARTWPAGTRVRLVTAAGPGGLFGPDLDVFLEDLDALHAEASKRLTACGLDVSSLVVEGDPRKVVVETAEVWGADAIFVGTRDLSRAGRWALGSVSGAILTRAHCSVEVVRSGAA
jgi:nucleotide-binding universal stress UspA family protein